MFTDPVVSSMPRGAVGCPGTGRRATRARRRCRAFSLLEMLWVLALVYGLGHLALPTFTDAVCWFRVEWTAHALIGAIGYARAEAVRRGASVTVCRSDAQDRCSSQPRDCAGQVVPGDDWRCGWAVVAGRPVGRAGLARLPVLRRFSAPRGVAVRGSRGTASLTFRPPSGLAPGVAGHLEVLAGGPGEKPAAGRAGASRDPRLARLRRCLFIGMSGRVRVGDGPCVRGGA